VERILALEFFAAAQAIDFRKETLGAEAKLGRGTEPAYHLIREHVPFLIKDAVMYPKIETVRKLITSGELRAAAEASLVG
jgi:histidine ammonia-lyase